MTSITYMLNVSSTSVQHPWKIWDNTVIWQSPVYITQGRRWDCAHRAGALTLEPLGREQSWSPPLTSPRSSGPTFACGELTPLALRNGVTQPRWVFLGQRDIYFSSKQTFFSGNIALNFKNQSQWGKNYILQHIFWEYIYYTTDAHSS